MIRNEVVTVTVNAIPIYPTSVSITASVGSGYNNCTIVGKNITASVGDTVVVVVNGDSYTFIIDEKDYGLQDNVSLTCLGTPVTLSDGGVSNTEYTYITSDELITDSVGSISVINNIPTITFNGLSYSKDSTPLSRISDMVDVVGGDMYEVNGILHLDEKKSIPASPTIAHTFLDSEVTSFAYSDKRDTTLKVKQVLFNPIVDDIYVENSVTLDFNDGKGEVFFNPSLTLGQTYTIDGIEDRPATVSTKTEKISVDTASYINTLGGIDLINYIKVNGEPLIQSEYTLYAGYNVVRFNTVYTGEVEISYKTKSVIVYAYRTLTFNIKYSCAVCTGTIEVNADNVVNSGKCYAEIKTPLTYENGGNVWLSPNADATVLFVEEKGATNLVQTGTLALAGGGTLTIKHLYTTTEWVDTAFMDNLTSSLISSIETASSEIIYDEDLLEYVVYLDKPALTINDIYFGSSVITGYTYVGTGTIPYITFGASDIGKKVDISFNVQFVNVVIPAPLVGHPVTLLDVITCSGVATSRFELDSTVMCNLPATFDIDVASVLGLTIDDVFGATLTGDFGNLVVNNFGKVTVTVSTSILFTIYADSVKQNATIKVDANGVI